NRYILLAVMTVIVLLVALGAQNKLGMSPREMTWSEFRKEVEAGHVQKVRISGREYYVEMKEGTAGPRKYVVIGDEKLSDADRALLNEKGVEYSYEQQSQVVGLLLQFLPWAILIGLLWYLFLRQLRGTSGPGGVFSFGKSRATLVTKERTKKTFKDVAGIDEAREEVEEIIGFLRNPKKYQRLGGRIPKGVLLIGPPGTGKTLLAKAIAGEADVPFFSISGSDFVELFVGVGASRVRDLFQQAKENSPCIIFLDEIDAVGRRRGTGLGGGHDEREQTLNEILVQMDGFESDDKVIVMAATNRPDVLDPALLRPGRFDRHIYVDLPDIKGREEILRVHAKKVRLAPDVDLSVIAKATPMFSGADLENLINEAALSAVRKDKDAVDLQDLEEARDKVIWGKAKKSRVVAEEDRWATAYHEGGHALVAYFTPAVDKPHKVTIIPRGPTLGATSFLPEKDVYTYTRKKLLGQIKVAFGGRIAEEMFTGDISTGARNDIEQATKIARSMVCEWGMSERLGPIRFGAEEETLFLGREVTRTHDHSEETARQIDEEVRNIVKTCYDEAKALLDEHKDKVERLAKALMEYEVLSREELDQIVQYGEIRKPAHGSAARAGGEKSHAVKKKKSEVVAPGGTDVAPKPGTEPATG
ncbi:MAG: ATP-dependent zinc metalloprotease FtsH, partial [Planctomycetota bacterium]|nr:ATP-dependent zinc metalloprotease FtsH [Planctomycetota bacterium]